MIMCWVATIVEIAVLSVVYFHTWVNTALLLTFAILFFAINYRRLEKSYHWFEKRLVSNIKSKSKKHERYESLAPWDTHFVEVVVSADSPLVGRTLLSSQLRQRFGINIVAIYGSKETFAPRGDQVIHARDKLIVLGNDEQIEIFRKKAAYVAEKSNEEVDVLSSFGIKPFVLEKDSPMVGKTIRESGIREHVDGLVVGLERGETRVLNPDPAMVLMPNDLLLIVGETSRLKEL
jgi:CPA2 family monovalent cation:H+ antiporter-2